MWYNDFIKPSQMHWYKTYKYKIDSVDVKKDDFTILSV